MSRYQSPGVYVEEVSSGMKPIAGVGTSTAGFIGELPSQLFRPLTEEEKEKKKTGEDETTDPDEGLAESPTPIVLSPANSNSHSRAEFALPEEGEPKLCTNFSEFIREFGDFDLSSTQGAEQTVHDGHNTLAHAVYGFFNNGGTRCWVARVAEATNAKTALDRFKEIDEIALVAFPGGSSNPVVGEKILSHCEDPFLRDRFAILDPPPAAGSDQNNPLGDLRESSYGAIYYPNIKVFDPVKKEAITVPPSGHIAGIYARVDGERGVFKSPANEIIRGALDVEKNITKEAQAGLNPKGINVIRKFGGSITVWGARTLSVQDSEWRYINVRRLFLFLRKSIENGTQWVVFEPNDPALWAKITRNVTAFLTNVWQDGALLGNTPQEAFYVKCDAENNPDEVRSKGEVVTEIGVAVTKPAEFVIFRISQWSGNGN
jgi:uncharacterized protein